MALASVAKKSLNEKNPAHGCRFVAASEDDKRFCTIQVTLCANAPTQDVVIELIFRNDTGGERISVDEKHFYNAFPNVHVRSQRKAWADESIMTDYVRDFRLQTLDKGDVALVLDRHGSQATPRMRTMMEMLDIECVFTPANCTDCVSPVDPNVGVWLKRRVYQMQEDELELPENRNWGMPVALGGLTTMAKRKHTVRWISQAWSDFQAYHQNNCTAAFVDTGILTALDGSEKHKINSGPKQMKGNTHFNEIRILINNRKDSLKNSVQMFDSLNLRTNCTSFS